MLELTCATLHAAGLWPVSGCCEPCHVRARGPALVVEFPGFTGAWPVTLRVCCAAEAHVDFSGPHFFALLREVAEGPRLRAARRRYEQTAQPLAP